MAAQNLPIESPDSGPGSLFHRFASPGRLRGGSRILKTFKFKIKRRRRFRFHAFQRHVRSRTWHFGRGGSDTHPSPEDTSTCPWRCRVVVRRR